MNSIEEAMCNAMKGNCSQVRVLVHVKEDNLSVPIRMIFFPEKLENKVKIKQKPKLKIVKDEI